MRRLVARALSIGAEPGQVVIGHETASAIGVEATTPLPPVRVKGREAPVQSYLLNGG